jgi:hypothetical protein
MYLPGIASIDWLSIDTIELYERNMIDELARRLVHGSYRQVLGKREGRQPCHS